MRSSVIAAMCAAPLALAGSIQQDLAGRGVVQPEVNDLKERQVTVIQSKGQDIVIIWTNNGAGAENQPVNAATPPPPPPAQADGGNSTAPPGQTTHTVVVGGASGLVYSPDSIQAAVGDMVVFKFMSQNHTVTQSLFNAPCQKKEGGMDSEFMANLNNTINPPPAMAIQVMTTDPMWFYCKQKGHCGKGMTFSINPSVENTQQMFQSMAIATNGTGAPSAITGGIGAAPPAAAPPAAAAGPGGDIVQGTGTAGADGVCTCACQCSQGSFPAAAQGMGMFGGMPGAIPMALLEK